MIAGKREEVFVMKYNVFFLTVATIVICFCSVAVSFAGLGGRADSVEHDRKALSATRQGAANKGGYSVEEMVVGTTSIREYIRSDGTVFAVAWNGYAPPDLTQLLGEYSEEYTAALKKSSRARGRRQQQIVGNNVVVERWGRMRDLHGRAYIPALIPRGVAINEIN
jgi:hypothetical protein